MGTSLVSGLSGLRAHQQYLDVIGHNLANVNTDGFKGSRVTFADLVGTTLDPGSAPTGTVGGSDPDQVGAGTTIASIDRDMGQGTLRSTGRDLDLAIQGNGFFVLQAPDRTLYSRVGTFAVDAANDLIDQRSGHRVLSSGGTTITLPLDSVEAGQATSTVTMTGNLPGEVTGPFAEILASTAPWSEGSAAQVTGTGNGPFALAASQTLQVRVDGGTAQTVTFNAVDFANISAATAAEVAAAINAQTTGLTASVAGAAVALTSERTGTESSLDVDDGTGSPALTLGLSTALTRGASTAATASTGLNVLSDNVLDYAAGDQIHISGTEADGTSVSATFVYGAAGNGTTLGELRDFLAAQFTSATATIDSAGRLVMTADTAGAASLSLSLADDTGNTGSTRYIQHHFEVRQPGADPDRVRTAIEIFDSQGRPHALQLEFERSSTNEWNLNATLTGSGGTLTDAVVQGIRFTSTGAFEAVTGAGGGDADFTIEWTDLGGTLQTISLDLGTAGLFDGLTQFGGQATASATRQNGYGTGSLESLSVNRDGVIQGFYSNGQTRDLETIGLAGFANPSGLEQVGETLFAVSTASGAAAMGQAATGGLGTILAGSLEQSNVDLAQEFVRLIEAQRGFQANARMISTTDEILAELVQIV